MENEKNNDDSTNNKSDIKYFDSEQYEKLHQALVTNSMTTFTFIVAEQVFKDKEIKTYHKENPLELSEKWSTKLWDRYEEKNSTNISKKESIKYSDGFYRLIDLMIDTNLDSPDSILSPETPPHS